jgi:hypothetical protein
MVEKYIFEKQEEGTKMQTGFNFGLIPVARFYGDVIESCDSINVRYMLTNWETISFLISPLQHGMYSVLTVI